MMTLVDNLMTWSLEPQALVLNPGGGMGPVIPTGCRWNNPLNMVDNLVGIDARSADAARATINAGSTPYAHSIALG
ncbi:hypothetical protein CEXT_422331 [Caerostris extrusa]|uniref:Uncharacterized protein n=1 Tax=Caerostris extrusa TaxID=172846 RepID=A0AAV4U9I0_CAEEX|nr:hypothetical protein CEXT_422331 [Caerostris extrusa]